VYLTADSPNELTVLDPSKVCVTPFILQEVLCFRLLVTSCCCSCAHAAHHNTPDTSTPTIAASLHLWTVPQVYILGGLVDRNRHKGICYKRALDAGIATARLPITQHMKLHTSAVRRTDTGGFHVLAGVSAVTACLASLPLCHMCLHVSVLGPCACCCWLLVPLLLQVITVNQVVDIMSRLLVNPDWRAVLEAVLPGRKRADAAAAAGGGGSGSKEPSPAPQGSRPAGTSGTEAAAGIEAAAEAAEAADETAEAAKPAAKEAAAAAVS
jgi:hypothetical protein